jgi:hypothetical protein
MAWIESHTSLARHPKLFRLCRVLEISVPAAIGHLHLLWHWAIEYAESGDLSVLSEEEIAAICLWDGSPRQLVESLVTVGFLDRDGEVIRIHNWDKYAGRLLADRERKRLARAKEKPEIPVISSNSRHDPGGEPRPQAQDSHGQPQARVTRARNTRERVKNINNTSINNTSTSSNNNTSTSSSNSVLNSNVLNRDDNVLKRDVINNEEVIFREFGKGGVGENHFVETHDVADATSQAQGETPQAGGPGPGEETLVLQSPVNRPRKVLAHPLPVTFSVTPEMAAFAARLGMTEAEIEYETEKFRDHFLAKQTERKTDWVAAWRNWMRRASERTQRPGHGLSRPSPDATFRSWQNGSPASRTAANFERAMKRLGLDGGDDVIETKGDVR